MTMGGLWAERAGSPLAHHRMQMVWRFGAPVLVWREGRLG